MAPPDISLDFLEQLLASISAEEFKAMLDALALERARQRISDSPKSNKVKKFSKMKPLKSVAVTKRPLNSWMAFRVYYAPIFNGKPQKDISGYLRSLWSHDPFKAKWSIIARAYSIVRDELLVETGLPTFLKQACPAIGLIGPQDYLSKMGWQLIEAQGSLALSQKFAPNIGSFEEKLLKTNMSVNDVVVFTFNGTYDRNDMRPDPHQNINENASVFMAMASRPNVAQESTSSPNAGQNFSSAPQATSPSQDSNQVASIFGPFPAPQAADTNAAAEALANPSTPSLSTNETSDEDLFKDIDFSAGGTNDKTTTWNWPTTCMYKISDLPEGHYYNGGNQLADAELRLLGESIQDQFDPEKMLDIIFDPLAGDEFDAYDSQYYYKTWPYSNEHPPSLEQILAEHNEWMALQRRLRS